MNDRELTIELAKNRADEYIVKKELDMAKKKLIEDLEKGLGNELKTNINKINKPIKIKKPFKIKIRDFFNRINKVLG